MAERIKVLADWPDNLSHSDTYMVEREPTPTSCLLTFMHTSWYTHMPQQEYQIYTI